MSLILEALRKSEAERRRGQVPSLYSELPVPGKVATQRRPWPWVLAALALVIAAMGWWRPSLPSSSPAAREPDTAAVAAPSALPNAAPRFVEPAVTAPPPTRPVSAVAPPPAPLPTPAEPAPSTAPSTRDAAIESPPVASAPATPIEPVLNVGELDPQSRAALPPLRLSMHVWHEQPAERFAIVDGQRVGEGDRLGDAVIEQIEADGLRLFWRGQRLRVARP